MSRNKGQSREKYSDNEYSDNYVEKKKYDSESDKKECECHMTKNLEELYQYNKYRLLVDPELLVAGSNAFVTATNTITEVIPKEFAITLENSFVQHNIDHLHFYSPFHVRKSGIYNYYFVINCEEAAQVCVFVNGLVEELNRVGNNSGAGQLVMKGLLHLNKDDCVVIRNNESSLAAITSTTNVGGTKIGNPSSFLLVMISPLVQPVVEEECLSRKEMKVIKKLTQLLTCDTDLMLYGYNKMGSFFTKVVQNIDINNDVLWDNYLNVNGMELDTLTPNNIKILEDGFYKIVFVTNVNKPAQFVITINGIPIEHTIQGVNKGASQLSIRCIEPLKKGDFVSIRNYGSVTPITITADAGGSVTNVAAILTLHKISPLNKTIACYTGKLNYCKKHYYKNIYTKLKNYLLTQPEYMIAGSKALISVMSDTRQDIVLEQPISWDLADFNINFTFLAGSYSAIINVSGIYELTFDILCNQAPQVTMFVNGVPDNTTTTGRNSGSSRMLMKQNVRLMKGDVVSFLNHTSNAGTLSTAINAGGILVGKNRTFILFLLTPIAECNPITYKSMKCLENKTPVVKIEPPKKEYEFY